MGSRDPMTEISGPIIFFDGVCNLCNGAVQFIIRQDASKKFTFVSLQAPAAERLLGNSVRKAGSIYSIILLKHGKIYDRSDAILEIAKELDGFWSSAYIFRFLPRFLRDGLYGLVAKYRYKLFGKQDACMIPTPELRARFLE